MNKLLTIIVPVYKVEPYINKCLDSCVLDDEKLMEQLEVIIVNDGTPDNSAEMSREYVKRYPQTFRQIDKENGGHGSAWNVGLKEATGKYLRFLDSDDWLTNLDKLMEKLQTTDADLVLTPKNEVYVDGPTNLSVLSYEGGNTHTIEKFDFSANRHMSVVSFQYTTYKREIILFGEKLFLEHCAYDDTILFTAPLIRAKSYVIFDFVVYNYLLGREGQTADPIVAQKKMPQRVQNLEYMSNFFCQHENDDISTYIKDNASIIISRLAAFLFADIKYLSFNEARKYSKRLEPYLRNALWKPSKIVKRYLRFPFSIWYFMERVNMLTNRK